MLATSTKNNLIPSSEDNSVTLDERYSIYCNMTNVACDL